MANDPATSDYVTKQDLDDFYVRIEKMVVRTVSKTVNEVIDDRVGDIVGGIISDALQIIAERFDRLEDKVDALSETVDHHTIDIRELRRRIA